jgi:hypothetical protein
VSNYGVGKTLSARHFTHWDEIESLPDYGRSGIAVSDGVLDAHTVFYTAKVINTPRGITGDLEYLRGMMLRLCRSSKQVMDEMEIELEDARRRDHLEREACYSRNNDWRIDSFWFYPRSEPTVQQLLRERYNRHEKVKDPTELIIIDEADRLKIQTLEQVRHIFDQGGIGLILIGMPSLEKQLARYPQLYSRIGFVHEYGLLSPETARSLLHDKWLPADIKLPVGAFTDEEGIAAIIRIAQGNFRRLFMVLMQVARILELNPEQSAVTAEVVNAARAGLLVGLN